MSAYYTKVEAEAAFISPAEQIAFQGDYYNKTEVDNALLNYLSKAGGTMSGYITLHASPTLPTHPATKIYVDNHINSADPHPSIQIALGGQTTGNYVASIQGTLNQVNVSGSGSETAAVTLSLPQSIDTGATPTFKSLTLTQAPGLPPFTISSNTRVPNLNASQLEGRDSNFLLAWENFINKPDPTVTVSVTGALTGSGSTVWTDMAGNLVVTVPTTLSTGSGSGLNADLLDGLDATYFLNSGNQNAGTLPAARLSGAYTINVTGALTGNASTATTLQTSRNIAGKPFNGSADVTLSSLTAGTGITPAGSYNGSAAVTINVDSTSLNTASKIVARDASGGFAAGAITATGLSSPAITLSLADGGAAPMTVTSRVKVTNLNADLLDGNDSVYFAKQAEIEALLGDLMYVGLYNAAGYNQVTGVPKPAPIWSGGSTVYRHGMYWVASSVGTLNFLDSDLSGRYDVDDDTVTVANGDWIVAIKNPIYGPPTTGQNLTLAQVIFQFIPFSAEAFVNLKITEHANQVDPHPLAGYLKKVATDSWYALIDHEHDEEIAEYIVQHTERTVYDIIEFSAVAPTGGAEFGTLTLKLATAEHNFYRGSGVSISFPINTYPVYNGMATVQTVAGSTITVNTKGPTRATTPGPIVGSTFAAKLTAEPHPDYLLITTAEQTYSKADHNHAIEIAAAVALHATPNTDPHPEYFNTVRADLRFEKLGEVNKHIGDQTAHSNLYYTKAQSDSKYSPTAMLADHLVHPDPHPQYLLQDEADALFSNEGHNHNDLYYGKTQVVDLIAAATPKNILATDGASSARIFLGNITPADPRPGDLWVQSDNVSLQPPVPPVALTGIALSDTSIRLTWNAWPASTTVQSVTVQMSPTGAVGSYVTLTPPPGLNAVSYDVTGLAEDVHYWFRVTAVNSVSNPVVENRNWGYVDLFTQNLTPPIPAGVAISTTPAITPTTFRLSWSQPSPWVDPGAAGARYEVALTGTTPLGLVPAGNVVGTSGFYDFTSLVEVTAYQPKVRSVDRSGLRSDWVSVNASTTNAIPPVPGAISITTNSTTAPQVTGTWTKYAGTIPDFSYYEVQLINASDVVLATTNTTALTWTAPETSFGIAVRMRVRTVDVTGGAGGVSAYVTSAAVTTKSVASVTVTPTSTGGNPNDQMTITWTTVTGLDFFSGYEVILYRAGAVAEVADVAANVTSRGWSNLSWGVSYTATVRVKRSAGTAPAAGPQATARTMLPDPIPGIDAGGSGQTVYGTLYAPAMPSTGSPNMAVELWYRGGNHIATQYLGAGTVAYRWDGLPWGTGYSTRVITTRASGYQWGSWSGWAQADTGPVPDTTPPALPTGLYCGVANGYGMWYAWMNWPGDAVGCHIDRLWSGAGYWENMYAGPPASGVHMGTGSAGQSMQFRARSHDAAGNWSGYQYSNTYTLTASPTAVACVNTDCWRPTNGGEYFFDGTKRPIQGYYTNASWNAVGMWYYGDNIRNACVGKTVTGIRVLIIRYNGGGNSGAETINLLLHNDGSDPGRVTGWGSPNGYYAWVAGGLGWGQSLWSWIPNYSEFWAGSARGVCSYTGGGKPYVIYESVDANGYQGLVEVYHYG
jgi:hypothetical protein